MVVTYLCGAPREGDIFRKCCFSDSSGNEQGGAGSICLKNEQQERGENYYQNNTHCLPQERNSYSKTGRPRSSVVDALETVLTPGLRVLSSVRSHDLALFLIKHHLGVENDYDFVPNLNSIRTSTRERDG